MSSDPEPPRSDLRLSSRAADPHAGRPARMPFKRPARDELEELLEGLDVSFIKLTECLIDEGWRLPLSPVDLPGLHYVLTGHGVMTFEDGNSSPISPHTLVIQPPGQQAWVDVPRAEAVRFTAGPDTLLAQVGDGDAIPRRFAAGDGAPALIFICGYFRVQHGRTVDLFAQLTAPIVEAFDTGEGLDGVLKAALAELLRQDLGTGIMTAALMKQVLVQLFRRALTSRKAWVDNFAILGDAQISRAFAAMVARPGTSHSVLTLTQTAGLSRSIFVARFSKLFGQSPMAVLRGLRMRRAAALLATDDYHIDQVAHLVGYANRSSFCRAFRKAYGHHPSAHILQRERLK